MHNACLLDSIEKCGILGISQLFSQINKSAVVVHGPKGCAYPAYEVSLSNPLNFGFTAMCEKHIVKGGEEIVKEKILETYFNSYPEIMAVITTCSSEIIGDDIEGIISNLDLSIPVIKINGTGFLHNHVKGVNSSLKAVVKNICNNYDNKADMVNLISPIGISEQWSADVRSLSNLLTEFGIKNRPIFLNTTLDEIKSYGFAKLNVMVNKTIGMDLALYMREKFNIPFVSSTNPIGLEATETWVKSIANALNVDLDNKIEQKIISIKKLYRKNLGRVTAFRPMDKIRKMKIMIIAEDSVALSYASFLKDELEFPVDTIICKDFGLSKNKKGEQLNIFSGTKQFSTNNYVEIKEIIEREKPEIIMCNDIEYYFAREVCAQVYINISPPGARQIHFYDKPFMGYRGSLNFIEELYNKGLGKF